MLKRNEQLSPVVRTRISCDRASYFLRSYRDVGTDVEARRTVMKKKSADAESAVVQV
jgi:hypothetical protein